MKIKNVTIAGGGVLGAQIAYITAFHGYNVTIWGRSEGSIERVRPRIDKLHEIFSKELEIAPSYIGAKNPDYPRSFFNDKSEITEKRITELKEINQDTYNGMNYTTDLDEAFANADLVIEAIAEVVDEKKAFYQKITPYLKDDAILVTNSSTLLPSTFRDYTGRQERFLSLHFANSIWRQNLAEVMGHDKTSEEVFDIVVEFAKSIGMYPAIIKKEQPGYILNSILVPFIDAGLRLYGDDIASPHDIDMDWKLGTGSPRGPFEIIDIVGITTVINITSANPESKDPNSALAKAVEKLKERADKGLKGVESGEGFYKYN
ncbi:MULTISPECIES: 3-hydroxyacyl-CoA dehydrogenase [Anaerococcus]|uniref:3-hydroxyacyl-CoA dehydrogenase n=1 Tax=Anaerococcus TaxID=165779 RepID=UPI001AE7688E|nr:MULTISPECIES: 3-hydroxyacyl-CoA dehydrogenase [Anaerococcus]MBP2069438.1 3-hydroxybutyryl-CoA dehydrogenase [Anaerococcus nagyae]MDU1829106.1 3-hydroxyacyl-CoA dehydrogenase [Anaerococcus sp.]MDU1864301.1 3-hydroxyacyl-CoA dehydrogenase [Anaerococcus sp.]MDU3211537.1 3-hydroxyacyl-CoA dehydrogenase [Anaerococcus sp.]